MPGTLSFTGPSGLAVPISAANPLPTTGGGGGGAGDASAANQATQIAQIGEVQASPTANTLLDRLKQLLSGIALAAGTNVIGHIIVDSGAITTVSTVTTVAAVTAITNALPAGTNLLGKVSVDQTTPGTTNAVTRLGLVKSFALAPTTSGAYASGDVIGGIQSITTVNLATTRRVRLQALTVVDKSGNSPPLRVYLFKVTPAAGTYTDNSALAWGSGDAANQVAVLDLPASVWLTDAGQSSVTLSALDLPLPVGATTLFALIVAEGAVTLANGDLKLSWELDQE